MHKFGFFFRKVGSGSKCTSQILLDGSFVTINNLCHRRESAQIEIFPCQGPCCVTIYPLDVMHKIPPLNLFMSLTRNLQNAEMLFSLSRRKRELQTFREVIPGTTKADGLICVDVTLNQSISSVSVYMTLGDEYRKSVELQGNLPLHMSQEVSDCLRLQSSQIGLQPPETDTLGFDWYRWSTIDLFGTTYLKSGGHHLFDDRIPMKNAYGAVVWEGLEHQFHVKVCQIMTWSTGGTIVGIMTTYDVNGIHCTAPPHLFAAHAHNTQMECVQLAANEEINRIDLAMLSNGYCSHFALSTTQNTSYTLGKVNPMACSARQKSFTLPPSSRIVAFRGAHENCTLNALGMVIESSRDRPVKVARSALSCCMICGASRTYFNSSDSFDRHVLRCRMVQSPAARLCFQIP